MVMAIARIAIYDDLLSSPRIIDVDSAPLLRFIEAIAVETYEQARSLGGRLPYSVIREIAENFIHADFKQCTVSILDRGNTIRFSDRGPGIDKKLLVLQPGITSASDDMRRYIKGVGSGFPIVREYLEINQGSLRIDDNAANGAVITLSLTAQSAAGFQGQPGVLAEHSSFSAVAGIPTPASETVDPVLQPAAEDREITTQVDIQTLVNVVDPRTRAALEVIAELGAAGPTDLMKPLAISAATGTRLLDKLESAGLIEKTSNRKRILSNAGLVFLQRSAAYQG
jgi:predicted transcriptional regulator